MGIIDPDYLGRAAVAEVNPIGYVIIDTDVGNAVEIDVGDVNQVPLSSGTPYFWSAPRVGLTPCGS